MTGPVYPRPVRGSIGTFIIGVSPIGNVAAFDVWTTIISQYANSPTLTALIEAFNDAVDPTQNIESFYDLIWNVLTAQGYGLDVWGRIVGVGRTLQLPSGGDYLGFEEAGASWTGFGQGGLFSGQAVTSNLVLADADFRTLILAKAAGNISDGSIPALNDILMTLFRSRGDCYVTDNLDMTATLTFTFPLTPVELAIIEQSGVLPIPAGIAITVAQP